MNPVSTNRNGAQSNRWQAFATAIALALGVNLWISLVLAPGLAVGAFTGSTIGASLAPFTLLLPLVLLGIGIKWRNETILLFAFPSALLIPISLAPDIASGQVYGPIRMAIVGIGLVAFLSGASSLTSFREMPAPKSRRPLKSSFTPIANRWRRRTRLYMVLALLGLVYPLVLLYHVNFDAAGARALSENYPGRAATFTTLLNVGVVAMWLLLLSYFFLAPLRDHRRGDKNLRYELSSIRASAARQRPRMLFYLCGLTALVLMGVWFLWHY